MLNLNIYFTWFPHLYRCILFLSDLSLHQLHICLQIFSVIIWVYFVFLVFLAIWKCESIMHKHKHTCLYWCENLIINVPPIVIFLSICIYISFNYYLASYVLYLSVCLSRIIKYQWILVDKRLKSSSGQLRTCKHVNNILKGLLNI